MPAPDALARRQVYTQHALFVAVQGRASSAAPGAELELTPSFGWPAAAVSRGTQLAWDLPRVPPQGLGGTHDRTT